MCHAPKCVKTDYQVTICNKFNIFKSLVNSECRLKVEDSNTTFNIMKTDILLMMQ